MLTIKSLKAAIANLPDDMPVAINESVSEATGLAEFVSVITGANDENLPYDKGDDVYATNGHVIKQDTHVCFIHS